MKMKKGFRGKAKKVTKAEGDEKITTGKKKEVLEAKKGNSKKKLQFAQGPKPL